ncbi:MAG: hypothetical protein ABI646_06860 [Acidobacteriota bacterium]
MAESIPPKRQSLSYSHLVIFQRRMYGSLSFIICTAMKCRRERDAGFEKMMLLEVLEKVKLHWIEDGIAIAPSPDKTKIANFFSDIGVEPSEEVFTVFSVLGGFINDDMDSECLTFWTLEQIRNYNGATGRETGLVHFADFLINSHTYAFGTRGSAVAAVCCHYDKDYIVNVSDSLQSFFELYLMEPRKLFP